MAGHIQQVGLLVQVAIAAGLTIASSLCFTGTDNLWPICFGVAAVPAVIQLATMPFCPESPRYLLINRNKQEEAEKGKNLPLYFKQLTQMNKRIFVFNPFGTVDGYSCSSLRDATGPFDMFSCIPTSTQMT